jgi:TfoX/Sxy family transcriptional regulator of competence genes
MASDREFVDFVCDQIRAAGAIAARKMFGEYALYCDGKVVALVCDNRLFVKPTPAGRAFAVGVPEGLPYRGARPYLLVEERLDDAPWLSALVRTTADALPPPRPRAARPARRQAKT